MTRHLHPLPLALVAIVLAVVALVLVTDNPSISSRTLHETLPCVAPYDAVLNNAGGVAIVLALLAVGVGVRRRVGGRR